MTERDPQARFDALLAAMLSGTAPSERKKPSTDQASGEADDACYGGTQTPPDRDEDASS